TAQPSAPRDTAFSTALAAAGYNSGPSAGLSDAAALDFLDAQTPAKPFFLSMSWPSPATVPVTQKELDPYTKTSFEAMGWDQPAPNATQKEMLRDVPGNLRKYAAGLTTLDGRLAPLFNRLQEHKLSDNTLIIFTASYGSLLGHHGLRGDSAAS